MCAETEQVEEFGVEVRQRTGDAAGEECVVRALPAQRSVDELGAERRVATGQACIAECLVEGEVRVRPLGSHLPDDPESNPPDPIRPDLRRTITRRPITHASTSLRSVPA